MEKAEITEIKLGRTQFYLDIMITYEFCNHDFKFTRLCPKIVNNRERVELIEITKEEGMKIIPPSILNVFLVNCREYDRKCI